MMRKMIVLVLICTIILILPACSNASAYTEKCKAAYDALAKADIIHYTCVQEHGIAGQDISTVSRQEHWIRGQDYLYYTNIDDAFDAVGWEVCKNGVAYEFSWGQWEKSSQFSVPQPLWKRAAWGDLQLKFRSATEEGGKLTVTFDCDGSLSYTVVFCFDASGSPESITISGNLDELNSQLTQEDCYTILSYDGAAIQETIDKYFATASQ